MRTCVTFDVDLVNYLNWGPEAEMETAFPRIREILERFPSIKTTWFFRIDEQISVLFGSAIHMFEKYENEISWLRDNGHEIGWHHHAYTLEQESWRPESDRDIVLAQLMRIAPLARKCGLTISRMGWGTQSTEITNFLEKSGFVVDSSAMSRPVYPWDKNLKDWEDSPNEPFYPTLGNYKIAGPRRNLLQVPMTTVELTLEGDTLPNVKRYLNPAYKTEYFKKACETVEGELIVTITHPYEIMDSKVNIESPLSFSLKVFEANLIYLSSLEGIRFLTISELIKHY